MASQYVRKYRSSQSQDAYYYGIKATAGGENYNFTITVLEKQ